MVIRIFSRSDWGLPPPPTAMNSFHTHSTEAYNDQYGMFTPTSKPQPQSPNLKAPTKKPQPQKPNQKPKTTRTIDGV